MVIMRKCKKCGKFFDTPEGDERTFCRKCFSSETNNGKMRTVPEEIKKTTKEKITDEMSIEEIVLSRIFR